MTQTSRFWDGASVGDAVTAPYDAGTEFSKVMMSIAGAAGVATNLSGVFRGELNELAVTGVATPVSINTGRALNWGTWYENDAATTVAIPTPAGATRIDRIVLRKDWIAQTVRVVRIAGAEGGGAPAITQSAGTTWDQPLARVSITTGGVITVTDERQFIGGSGNYPTPTGTNTILTSTGGVAAWSANPTIGGSVSAQALGLNVAVGSIGTVNGTAFGASVVPLHVARTGSGSMYIAVDNNGATGVLLNDSGQAANSRLWGMELASNAWHLNTYSDAGASTAIITVARTGITNFVTSVGINTADPNNIGFSQPVLNVQGAAGTTPGTLIASVVGVAAATGTNIGRLEFEGLNGGSSVVARAQISAVLNGATNSTYLSFLTMNAGSMIEPLRVTSAGTILLNSTAQRIQGDFSNATHANRVLFQTSTVNANTVVGVITNGSGTASQITTYSSSDPANSAVLQLTATTSGHSLAATQFGTGTNQPLSFNVAGSTLQKLHVSGGISLLGSTDPGAGNLRVDGNIGQGATPVAWATGYRAYDQGSGITALMGGNASNPNTWLMFNTYYDGAFKRAVTSTALMIQMGSSGLQIYADGSAAAGSFTPTARITMDVNGNLGIAAAPSGSWLLEINRSANSATEARVINGTNGANAYAGVTCQGQNNTTGIYALPATYTLATFQGKSLWQSNAAAGTAIQNTSTGNIQFYVASTTLTGYWATGGGLVVVTGGIVVQAGDAQFLRTIPAANNTYDLGITGTNSWRDVYCVRGAFNGSHSSLKREWSPIAPADALAVARQTEVGTFRYKPTDKNDKAAEWLRVGILADNAHPWVSPDRHNVNGQDTATLALAASVGVDDKVIKLQATIDELTARLARLEGKN